jgi:hypothetical protein
MDPDPTPFFVDVKDAKKKKIFIYFFKLIHHLLSKKFNFWLKFCVLIVFCRHCFSPLNTFMRKGKTDLYPDPGGPKHADPVPDPYPKNGFVLKSCSKSL